MSEVNFIVTDSSSENEDSVSDNEFDKIKVEIKNDSLFTPPHMPS